jgi:hypothetical protein
MDDIFSNLDLAIAQDLNAKKSSGQLDAYIKQNSDKIVDTINRNKTVNTDKVLGDLTRAMDTQKNVYYYYQRNRDMLRLGKDPIERMKRDSSGLIHDRDIAERQYEMNQWTSGNRADTLFVYQLIFICVLTLALFTSMWRMGVVSTGFLGLLIFALIIIIVLTIVNRAQYTAFSRDQRYWNKRQFPKFTASIPTPDCPTFYDKVNEIKGLANKSINYAQNLPSNAIGTFQSAAAAAAGGLQNAAASASALRQDVNASGGPGMATMSSR